MDLDGAWGPVGLGLRWGKIPWVSCGSFMSFLVKSYLALQGGRLAFVSARLKAPQAEGHGRKPFDLGRKPGMQSQAPVA